MNESGPQGLDLKGCEVIATALRNRDWIVLDSQIADIIAQGRMQSDCYRMVWDNADVIILKTNVAFGTNNV